MFSINNRAELGLDRLVMLSAFVLKRMTAALEVLHANTLTHTHTLNRSFRGRLNLEGENRKDVHGQICKGTSSRFMMRARQ